MTPSADSGLGRRGIALTIVVVVIVMISMVAAAALTLGYNQRLLAKKSGSRTQAYYFARAGLVDAQERIRRNIGGDFTNPLFDPAPYQLNVDDGNANDVTVDIGPRSQATGLRTLRATGRS